MRKFWPFLFLLVPILGVAFFWYAASHPELHWWMPKDISTHGHEIDHLFNVILVITTVAFILSEFALVIFLFKYQGKTENEKGTFIHGHHKAEVIWTAIPAVILAFIALYQFSTWKKIKFTDNFPKVPPTAEVLAGQFEWRMTYPGKDGKFGTKDDVESVNELHVPVHKPIILHLKSRDVIHSFFLPNLRLKQDVMPSMTIPVWFEATETGNYDLVCAELCGWGHYKMKGRLTVQTEDEFNKWLTTKKEEQEAVR